MGRNLLLLITALTLFSTQLKAQQTSTVIGELKNGVYEINETQTALTKAFEWTFRDGTKVQELKIEQLGTNYFLLATCSYQGRKRIAALDIEMVGINFVLSEDAQYKTCSAVACETCKFFLENNKIVACKCEESGTISNHCHYKSLPGAGYYANFLRAIKMQKD